MLAIALLSTLAQILSPVALADAPSPSSAPSSKPAAPQPKGSPRPKSPSAKRAPLKLPPRDAGVKTLPRFKPEPLVLRPRVAAKPLPETSFTLAKAGPGKLVLGFQSTRPALELDLKTHFTVQLDAPAGLEIQPFIITQKTWPPGARQIYLSYKGSLPGGQEALIRGAATYRVCEHGTHRCSKARCPIQLSLKP